MNISLRAKPKSRVVYPLQPILNSGLIMYARSYVDGVRTVTFEDPSVIFQPHEYTYFGKGTGFNAALAQALENFYTNDKTSHVTYLPINDLGIREEFKEKLGRRIDIWLFNHKGLLRAYALEDGTVQIQLEGYAEPANYRSRVLLEGTGKSFYAAFLDALQEYRSRNS